MKKISLIGMGLFFLSLKIYAGTIMPASFEKYFKDEDYEEAIESLDSSENNNMPPGKKDYLTALAYSRMKKYDQAILSFKKAINEKFYYDDLDYEFGQVLFGNNNLKQARYQFMKSAGRNFKPTASVYYAAHISELLDDYIMARVYYGVLIKDKRTDQKFLQIAFFQYAKVLLKMLRRQDEVIFLMKKSFNRLDLNLINYIPRYIFPLLNKAKQIDEKSSIAMEIDQYILELMNEFKLDPNILANGRRISADRFYGVAIQRFKYDDNIAYSKKSSAINETEIYSKYDFVFKKKYIVAPELRLTYTKHKDQSTPEIYKYDAFSNLFALRNKYEHKLFESPSAFLLDLDYGLLYRDWKVAHGMSHYSKTHGVTVGEQFLLSSFGETYLKIRSSSYTDKTDQINYKLLNYTFDQYFFLFEGQHLLITTLDFGQLRYSTNKLLDNDTYQLRLVYLFFELIPTYTLQLMYTTVLTDPKKTRNLRGHELSLSPSIDLTKTFNDKIRLGINYSYLHNSSNDQSYEYRKQVVGAEFSYAF